MPLNVSALDLSNYAGLTAVGLLTLNILLGLLLSVKYNPVRRWPHRRVNTVRLHNWTGYTALAVSFTHPIVLLFYTTAGVGVVDLLWPLARRSSRTSTWLARWPSGCWPSS